MNKQTVSTIRGLPVFAPDGTAAIGRAEQVFVDGEKRRLSAVVFKSAETGRECFTEASDIVSVDEDGVMLGSRSAIRSVTTTATLGRPVRQLEGMRVTTASGKHLGDLDDIGIGDELFLRELYLSGGFKLPVDPADVRIGADEVIVPTVYAGRVVELPVQVTRRAAR